MNVGLKTVLQRMTEDANPQVINGFSSLSATLNAVRKISVVIVNKRRRFRTPPILETNVPAMRALK